MARHICGMLFAELKVRLEAKSAVCIYTVTAKYKVKETGENRILTGPPQTSQRVACKYARDLARIYRDKLDDLYVCESGGRVIYHLHRLAEQGDGQTWKAMKS